MKISEFLCLDAVTADLKAKTKEEVIEELGMNWKVAIRNGDTAINERQKQKRQMHEVSATHRL